MATGIPSIWAKTSGRTLPKERSSSTSVALRERRSASKISRLHRRWSSVSPEPNAQRPEGLWEKWGVFEEPWRKETRSPHSGQRKGPLARVASVAETRTLVVEVTATNILLLYRYSAPLIESRLGKSLGMSCFEERQVEGAGDHVSKIASVLLVALRKPLNLSQGSPRIPFHS